MKKIISIILAVMLVASLAVVASAYSVYPDGKTSDEALAAYAEATGTAPETHKYYFQMPNGENGPVASEDVVYTEIDEETGAEKTTVVCKAGEHAPTWYHEGFTDGAGIYWWEGAAACESWAGYQAMVEDADQCIFYANVPSEVVMMIFNNGIDGGQTPTPGLDPAEDIYYKAAQTGDIASEYPDPDEYDSIPDGADSFDEMIVIVNPDKVSMNPLSKKMTCGYNWYFYYGDGCYGSYAKDGGSEEAVCCNPQHFDADGNHVGYVPSEEPVVDPTEPAEDPTEPAEPAEPTEPAEPAEPTEPAEPGEVVKGDLSGDGQVNNRDAMILDRYVAGWEGYAEKVSVETADLSGDGLVNNRDAMIIDRFVAGWEGYDKYFA